MTIRSTALSAAIAVAALTATSASAFTLSQTFQHARVTFKEASMTPSGAANRFCTVRGFAWAAGFDLQSLQQARGGYWGHAVFGSVTCRNNPLPTTSSGPVVLTP